MKTSKVRANKVSPAAHNSSSSNSNARSIKKNKVTNKKSSPIRHQSARLVQAERSHYKSEEQYDELAADQRVTGKRELISVLEGQSSALKKSLDEDVERAHLENKLQQLFEAERKIFFEGHSAILPNLSHSPLTAQNKSKQRTEFDFSHSPHVPLVSGGTSFPSNKALLLASGGNHRQHLQEDFRNDEQQSQNEREEHFQNLRLEELQKDLRNSAEHNTISSGTKRIDLVTSPKAEIDRRVQHSTNNRSPSKRQQLKEIKQRVEEIQQKVEANQQKMGGDQRSLRKQIEELTKKLNVALQQNFDYEKRNRFLEYQLNTVENDRKIVKIVGQEYEEIEKRHEYEKQETAKQYKYWKERMLRLLSLYRNEFASLRDNLQDLRTETGQGQEYCQKKIAALLERFANKGKRV